MSDDAVLEELDDSKSKDVERRREFDSECQSLAWQAPPAVGGETLRLLQTTLTPHYQPISGHWPVKVLHCG